MIGLALGLALAFGSFGQMLIVALFAVIGFVVAKVLEGDLDLSPTCRAASARPMTASTAAGLAVPSSPAGRTELGMISINDRVVEKMAARAAAEIPDAGAAAPGSGPLSDRSGCFGSTHDEPDRAAEILGRRRSARP